MQIMISLSAILVATTVVAETSQVCALSISGNGIFDFGSRNTFA